MAVEVNLMPGDDLEGKVGGKFLAWALSWGKKIVISTEAIVILAFLSRFWLDTTVADLSEKINQKKAIVEATASFETRFRSVSDRIKNVDQIDRQRSLLLALDKSRALIPSGAIIDRIASADQRISISGSADSSTLAVLVSNFKDSADFTDLTVAQLTKTGQAPLIDFSMDVMYIGQESK